MSAPIVSSLSQGSSLARFTKGFGYPIAGLRHLAATPRLWRYVVVPVFLTVVMIGCAAWFSWTQGPAALHWIWEQPVGEGGLAVVSGLAWQAALIGVRLLLLVVGAVLFYAVGGLLAVPFNDFLSQAVEESILGARNEPFTLALFLSDLRMSLGHSLLAVFAWLCVMVPILALNLVPGVGSVAASVLGGAVTSLFLAREMLDGPLSRDRLPFGVKLELIKAHRSVSLGFGAATAGLLWVPGLNLISMPCAVVGGTLLYCQLKRDGLLPPSRQRG